jgi:hypothetical protein
MIAAITIRIKYTSPKILSLFSIEVSDRKYYP